MGNLVAIILSSVVAFLICQSFFPDFLEEFIAHNRARKAAEKKLVEEKEAKGGAGKADQVDDTKDIEKQEKDGAKLPSNEKNNPVDGNEIKPASPDSNKDEPSKQGKDELDEVPLKPLVYPFGYQVTIFICDVLFSALAGFATVSIAGFARFNHAVLLALFLGVWKAQQLLGAAENQLPSTLLTLELIAIPLACVFGASFLFEPENEGPEIDVDDFSRQDA